MFLDLALLHHLSSLICSLPSAYLRFLEAFSPFRVLVADAFNDSD